MSTFVKIPFSNNLVNIAFPDKCIYCGLPAETRIVHQVSGESRYEEGRKLVTVTYSTELRVPYCKTHMENSKKNNIILTVIIVLIAIGLFVLLLGPGNLYQITNENLGAGGIFFLVIGSAGTAYVVFFLAKYLLSILFKTLRHQSGIGEFNPGLLGLKCTFTSKKDALRFKFVNAEVAKEFSLLNGQ